MQSSFHSFLAASLRLLVLILGAYLIIDPLQGQEAGFLNADKPDGKEETRFRELQNGRRSIEGDSPQEKADVKRIMEKSAKWHAYRLTFPRYQGEAVLDDAKGDNKTMHNLIQETTQIIAVPDPHRKPVDKAQADRQLEFSREFGRLLAADLKPVMKNEKPITRINAARILAHLGRAGIDESADLMVAALKDPNETDAVKLYAARGLRDLLALKQPEKKRELLCIQTLIDYLKQKSGGPSEGPLEELDALRYVRREAVRALGHSRYPNASTSGKADDATAYWLLRMARKDRITPEPNLSEQLEAAIGVCQLTPKFTKDYNLEAAAHHVGGFVVDFAGQSNNRAPGVPWKVYAARLSAALDELKKNAAGLPAEKKVTQMVTVAKAAIDPLEKGGNPRTDVLEQWLSANAPAKPQIFTSIEGSSVKAPEPGGN